jgi:hypothetical protein
MKLPTIQRAEKVMDELAEEEEKLIGQVFNIAIKKPKYKQHLNLDVLLKT